MRRWTLVAALVLLTIPALSQGHAPAPRDGPLVITPTNPLNGTTIPDQYPNITATFSDSAGFVIKDRVYLTLDGFNVTGISGYSASAQSVHYQPVGILKLKNGNHSVTVGAFDSAGNRAEVSWVFAVNTSLAVAGPALTGINVRTILIYIAIGAGVFAAAFAGYILYLKQTRHFTFRKYFATHPLQREYLSLYVPVVIAFLFLLVALVWIYSTPGLPTLAPEYVAVATLFVALTAYALDARTEKRRMRTYERAFAQFLFEMADAMRGGIDPAKAVVELSKTHTNILRRGLRVAADGIRMGRPFEMVLKSFAEPMRSPLITRYATLIADASTVGGETAAVIHRAAKDMDDFIKIEIERNQALTMPVAVLYIAFGVLLAVLFSLLSIAPSLGSINLSIISGSNPLAGATGGSAPPAVPKIDANTLKTRFFDLTLINALGTGVIIGAFTEGKAKYGLLHSLVLAGVTAIAFLLFAPV